MKSARPAPPHPNLTPPNSPHYQALIELLRTADFLYLHSRLLFARWDLSASQFNVLNVLRNRPRGLSQIDLSRELIMHRSNVTGLVDRLERRGLVDRLETPGDRRAYRVVLTQTGTRLLHEILPSYYAASEAVWAGVSATRARQLLADLKTVGRNAEGIAGQLAEGLGEAPASARTVA